jgi:nucleoside-diphosphate-sugar epimerase
VSPRRALITGAAGFVGASLARRLLADGHDVVLLVRPGSSLWRLEGVAARRHELDLRDAAAVAAALAAARPEWIFHLASHGSHSWETDARAILETNVVGTLNLLEAAAQQGFDAFVHAGSSSEYGFKDHAPTEDERVEPNSTYAVSKSSATLLCRQFAEARGLHVATLRLYSVYGPWEDPRRLMPTLLAHGLRGVLPSLVDPETARDFVYVEDVNEAFLAAASRHAPESDAIYNVGSGVQTTMRELVGIAQGLLGIDDRPRWGSHAPRQWDTRTWICDRSKAERELDWTPSWRLETGLAEMVAWFRRQPGLWGRYGITP